MPALDAVTVPAATTFFDFADQVALISSEVLRFRLRNRPRLADAEKAQLEAVEMRLDEVTAQLRALGVEALGVCTQAARAEIEVATRDAEGLLRRIRRAERALKVAASVVDLAVAAVARQPKQIGVALRGVRSALQGDSA
jgi:hypothetical protein